jgi:hypothetical protein
VWILTGCDRIIGGNGFGAFGGKVNHTFAGPESGTVAALVINPGQGTISGSSLAASNVECLLVDHRESAGRRNRNHVSTQISLPKAPLVLRLARNGNVWTGSWSTDGVTFTAAPSFTSDLNVAKVGPYAGTNASTASNSPAFTAIVDYFFATSNPIANLDGPTPYGYATVDANPPGTLVEKMEHNSEQAV